MPSTIFSGSKVKALKSTLNLNGGADIISSTTDPTAVAVNADTGSLLLNTTSGKLYRKNDPGSSTNWSEVGSGGSGINYITNPSAATNTTGWTTYADAAGSQPVDGTGGSPSVTWTRSETTPLRGSADFQFAKDAVNRQGQGVATDITIDLADQAKVLTVTFDYEVLSGTYATGDLTVYLIADPAGTPVVIQPAGYQVQSATSGTKMKHIATFQTQATGQTYRVCFHVASTSASAYTLAVDNVSVGPQVVQYGAPVTDWIDYTPSWTSSTPPAIGNGTLSGKWRRIGDSLHCRIWMTSGTTTTYGSGNWSFGLPSGMVIDTSKNPGGSSASQVYGVAEAATAASVRYIGNVGSSGTTTVLALQTGSTPSSNAFSSGSPFAFAATTAGQSVSLDFIVPIVGWSSTVQMSNDTDTRVVALAANRITSAQTITAAGGEQTVLFNNVKFDTHGSYNSTTGVITVPVSGIYRISVNARVVMGATAATSVNSYFQVDGSTSNLYGRWAINDLTNSKSYTFNPTALIELNAGQIIKMIMTATTQDVTVDFSSDVDSDISAITLERLSGPSAIAASESVGFVANDTAGDTIGTVVSLIKFTSIENNSHNAYSSSTGLFTAPVSGRYSASWAVFTAPVTLSTSQRFLSQLFKNGAEYKNGFRALGNGVSNNYSSIGSADSIYLNAGDTLSVYAVSSVATNATSGVSVQNYFSVVRTGN